MPTRDRALDILGAASVALAFGALFVGRVIMWRVAMAPGSFLARVRAEAWAWDVSHAVMTADRAWSTVRGVLDRGVVDRPGNPPGTEPGGVIGRMSGTRRDPHAGGATRE